LILREAEEKIQNTLRPKMANIDTYENLKDEIVKGSGEWIRDEILLINWLNRKRPILWIYGFPGAGKSFLSCSIIRYLEQLHPQGVQDVSRVSIGYFFFKNEDPGLRSFNTLLRTVSYQLTKNDPVYAKHVAGLCSSLGDGRSTSTLWKKLFLEFFYEKDTGSSAYIVIDGLDEANDDERERFFELLKSLEQNKGGGSNIQILLVGRPHVSEELEDVLGALPPNMELSPSKSSKDIEKYIHQTVRKSSKLRRRPKKLRDEIVSKLNAGANGFFLWAKLMLKELEMKDREDQMRAALNNLPKGLKNTLQQIVVRLSVTLDKDKVEDLNVSINAKPISSSDLIRAWRFYFNGQMGSRGTRPGTYRRPWRVCNQYVLCVCEDSRRSLASPGNLLKPFPTANPGSLEHPWAAADN
jgi:hypothetical protein